MSGLTFNVGGWRSPAELGRAPVATKRVTLTDAVRAQLQRHVSYRFMPDAVNNQGGVGSCVADTISEGCSALAPRAGYDPEPPSIRWLYWRARRRIGETLSDSGAIIGDAIDEVRTGWVSEQDYPRTSLVFDSSWTDEPPQPQAFAPRLITSEPISGVDTILWELAMGNLVAVGLRVTTQWMDLQGNELPDPSGTVEGGHAVLLRGYCILDDGRVFVRVRNSWTDGWGDQGEVWLPVSWLSLAYLGEAHALRAMRRREPPPANPERFEVAFPGGKILMPRSNGSGIIADDD